MQVLMQIRKRLSGQQGAVAILVAVLAIVLLGIGAFVIDFGYTWVTTNELQNAADAGALAGARALGKFYCPETDPDEPCKSKADQDDTTIAEVETLIKDAVEAVVNQNKAANIPISIDRDNGDIQIGTWTSGTKTFTPNATPPDAVRVRTRRDSTTNGPITTFLGNIFGVPSISLSKPATAALTGASQAPPGAINIPFGTSQQRDCNNPTVKFQDTKNSCGGWTGFFGATDTSTLLKLINDMHAGTAESPGLQNGDILNWDGGVKTPLFEALYNFWKDECILVGSVCTWQVYLPIYADEGTCDNPNQSIKVVGFTTMDITKVDCVNPGCSPSVENVIEGNLTCKVEPGRGGGGDGWSIGSIPGLVQ